MRWPAPLLLLALLAGCGGGDGSAHYTTQEIKAAYYRAKDVGGDVPLTNYWVDDEYHSHSNYVPRDSLETCPLTQRANAPETVSHIVTPKAAQPVSEFVVGPKDETDIRTPSITQGALLFGTNRIAGDGMKAVGEAMTKCPASYDVEGGPSPILGTYAVSARPFKAEGWSGVVQQIAHTFPTDDVYYEDAAHVVVGRANVILYIDVTHRKIIGERSDSSATAENALRTVLKRLG